MRLLPALPRRPTSLRTRLALAFAGLAAAGALSLSLMLGWNELRSAQNARARDLADVAHRLSDRLNGDMRRRAAQISVLAGIGDLAAMRDPVAIRVLLDRLKTNFMAYAWVGVADAGGRVVAATGGLLEGVDISARPWFQGGLRGPFLGDVHLAALLASKLPGVSGEPMRFVDVAVPLHGPDGALTGVLGAHVDWRWARDVEHTLVTPYQDRHAVDLLVVASDGSVLLGPQPLLGTKLALATLDRARTGKSDQAIERWTDGADYLTAAVPAAGGSENAGLGWTVVARQPVGEAFGPAWRMFFVVLGWGLAAALVFACVGWVLAHRIAAPLKRIALAADRVRRGAASEFPIVRGPREVELLSTSLRDLVATLTRTGAALGVAREAAWTDNLTSLRNRAGLQVAMEELVRQRSLGSQRLGVLCIDLDGFKQVNDTHGHPAGDAVLRGVAGRLMSCLRGRDVVARIGGDEFVVILDESTIPVTEALVRDVAARVLAAVGGATYEVPGASGAMARVQVGCSVGGALWPEDGDSLDDVVGRADEALYAAKRGGRNRFVQHGAGVGDGAGTPRRADVPRPVPA